MEHKFFWLDDFRAPPLGWNIWARDYEEATHLLVAHDYEHGSLDHDLCDFPKWAEGNKGKWWEGERTGLHVVEFMVEQNIWPSKTLAIHTDYDKGREQMADLIYTYGPYDTMDWYCREQNCKHKVWGYIFYGSEEHKAESLPECAETADSEEQSSTAAGW